MREAQEEGKILQVVKVFVAAGGLLQFRSQAQGNKSRLSSSMLSKRRRLPAYPETRGVVV